MRPGAAKIMQGPTEFLPCILWPARPSFLIFATIRSSSAFALLKPLNAFLPSVVKMKNAFLPASCAGRRLEVFQRHRRHGNNVVPAYFYTVPRG